MSGESGTSWVWEECDLVQGPRCTSPQDTSPQKMSALRTASAPMSEEMTFYRRERAQLVTLGITDYDDQSRELARRWKAIVDARARNVQRQSCHVCLHDRPEVRAGAACAA